MEGRNQLCLNWMAVLVKPMGAGRLGKGRNSGAKRERRKGGQTEAQSEPDRGGGRGEREGETEAEKTGDRDQSYSLHHSAPKQGGRA